MEETVTIKVENLKKAAELAGGHADVIKALAPEVFEPEVHDEVGSIYQMFNDIYMITKCGFNEYILVNIDKNKWYEYSRHGKQYPRKSTEFKAHIKSMVDVGTLKYLGHQRDIMTIKR